MLEGLVFGASVGEMVAGVIPGSDNNSENAVIDEAALEAREKVTETMHHARHAIEHRLVMEQTTGSSNGQNTPPADEKISQEATAILTHMKALMWDPNSQRPCLKWLPSAIKPINCGRRTEPDRRWRR